MLVYRGDMFRAAQRECQSTGAGLPRLCVLRLATRRSGRKREQTRKEGLAAAPFYELWGMRRRRRKFSAP